MASTNSKCKEKDQVQFCQQKIKRGLKSSFREELSINLGNKMLMPPLKQSSLQREIELFF